MSGQEFETALVIDDDDIVLSATGAMLHRHGYRVITSLSGKQAVELLEEWTDVEIDIALIDVILGDTTGPEVAKEIRRLRPQLPIIFMTGFPEHIEFLAAQGQIVLSKPFTSVALVQGIRKALDQPEVAVSAANSSAV